MTDVGALLLTFPDSALSEWASYLRKHGVKNESELYKWVDRWEFGYGRPIDAQQAIDKAIKLLNEAADDIEQAMTRLEGPISDVFGNPASIHSEEHPNPLQKAMGAVRDAEVLLTRGSLAYRKRCQPAYGKRGQPPTMRSMAVRAYIIRKYNPKIGWAELADLLFLEKGKCPRKIRDEDGTADCGVTRHLSDSPCVRALRTRVLELKAVMKRNGVPV